MQTVPLNTAHQFILHSQLLSPDTGLSDKAGVLHAIRRLGYVQIDTISVVERAHHHVLWSRVPDYEHAHLRSLNEDDREVFDYWAHAASYLPMEHYPYSLVRKANIDNGGGFWRLSDPELSAHVLKRIRKEGALMSRDFVKAKNKTDEPWRIPAINMVIRQLFMKGELMVSGRRGILKCFDLPERVLPKSISKTRPSISEYAEYIVRRDMQAHGLVKLSEFGHLLKVKRKEYQNILDKMIHSCEAVEVTIKGVEGGPYFAFWKALNSFSPTQKKAFHILSPFDNLVIQRKRLKELFGFDYTLECYVPAAKRKFGYFGLPLLYGHRFVGLMDAKADRKAKVLRVRKLEWRGKVPKAARQAFDKKLRAFAGFCGCLKVKYE